MNYERNEKRMIKQLRRLLPAFMAAIVLMGGLAVQTARAEDPTTWDLLDNSFTANGGNYGNSGTNATISKETDYLSIVNTNNSASYTYAIFNAANNGSNFILPSNNWTVEIKAKASRYSGNSIGVRTSANKTYHIFLDASAGSVMQYSKTESKSIDVTQWHTYRFTVGATNNKFSLYVDGDFAFEGDDRTDGSGTLIKVGHESSSSTISAQCDIDIEYVKAATGVFIPEPSGGGGGGGG
ncbi:MAG: hypothetical protein LBL96_10335, partial [Clostridiales bacterium]|nr:hypothetical protein [Clostridiales bacterium]